MSEKRRYVQIAWEGHSVTLNPVDVDDWLANEIPRGCAYVTNDVWMTDEEWEAMPEFEG